MNAADTNESQDKRWNDRIEASPLAGDDIGRFANIGERNAYRFEHGGTLATQLVAYWDDCMTVGDLVKYLSDFPQDAKVAVDDDGGERAVTKPSIEFAHNRITL